MSNEKIDKEYTEARDIVLSFTKRIMSAVEKYDTEPRTWCAVDELLYVAARLHEISDFLKGEGEHAE